jgi:hypothetical protein
MAAFEITTPIEDNTPGNILAEEASTVGLPVGYWPDAVAYEGVDFRLLAAKYCGDDLGWVDYRSEAGLIIRLYND